ncbi:hypothetical protein GSI_12460 [Ganoderma sinense ZZ0214-1]|uniref:Uncharacterized protein n=1 Tax=Ganoderma sinense ZZ0214-1 TaxID=1077348 RepID=A0A2G8RST4_9APHY|nr:hypothetical protein GSI_12460 [Ganoderma sinense ZZ0214-1]
MSNVGIDTWNLISGTIGVLTVLPFIWAFVRYQHPESKMAELESALKDTEALLRSVSEEGLLDPQDHIPHFTSHLTQYRMETEAFREETFIVSVSWRKTLVAWSRGLSKRIAILCEQVKNTRAEICETSAEQRMRLMNQDANDATPSYITWRVRILNFWRRMASVVYRSPAAETADTASQRSTTPVFDASAASTDGSDTRRASNESCREASSYRAKPRRSFFRVAADSRDLRMLTSAIRRIDRDLAAQGVSHVLLTQLAQTTRKHWSPASTRAHRPRSHKSRGAKPGPGPNDAVPSRHARQPSIDSDTYTSGEETVCEV